MSSESFLTGVVRGAYRRRRLFAVELAADDFIVFELLAGADPEVGDQVTELRPALGGQTIRNASQGRSHRVIVDYLHAPRAVAVQALRPPRRPSSAS